MGMEEAKGVIEYYVPPGKKELAGVAAMVLAVAYGILKAHGIV